MADMYWVTFKIAEDGDNVLRCETLMETLRNLSEGSLWTEPTSFALFESDYGLDEIAEKIASSFDPEIDLALVATPNFKAARAVGSIKDNDLFRFMPFTKKFP
jgi:hypothetical protein